MPGSGVEFCRFLGMVGDGSTGIFDVCVREGCFWFGEEKHVEGKQGLEKEIKKRVSQQNQSSSPARGAGCIKSVFCYILDGERVLWGGGGGFKFFFLIFFGLMRRPSSVLS